MGRLTGIARREKKRAPMETLDRAQVDDIDLPKSAGAVIEIGKVILEVTMEVDPCSRMDEQAEGLKAALTPDWRGGVACVVLEGGAVSVGDPVSIRPAD